MNAGDCLPLISRTFAVIPFFVHPQQPFSSLTSTHNDTMYEMPAWYHIDETETNARSIHTFIYKHASGLDLPLDVHIPTSESAQAAIQRNGGSVPVVFWLHGGGAVQGGRKETYQHLVNAVNNGPFILVSVDYRYVSHVIDLTHLKVVY